MSLLHLSELPPQRADEAFGLVRLGSDWSEAEWRQWLESGVPDRRGVLCATSLGGVLLGIAAYCRGAEEQPRPWLKVPLFVAFELGRKGTTRTALREGLERLAEQFGCREVRFAEDSKGLVRADLA